MRISILLFGVVASSYMLVEYHPGKATFFGAAAVLFLHLLQLGAATIRHYTRTEEEWMNAGRCPACHRAGTLEVTSEFKYLSDHHLRSIITHRIIACNVCKSDYSVETTQSIRRPS